MSEEKKKSDSKSVILGCGHRVQKQTLKKQIVRRTQGHLVTCEADQGGEKCFQCTQCFHVLRPKEMEMILGSDDYQKANMNVNQRAMELYDLETGQKKLNKIFKNCRLCDSLDETKATHDEHYFCRNCWKGVHQQEHQKIGCLFPDCGFAKKTIANSQITDWFGSAPANPPAAPKIQKKVKVQSEAAVRMAASSALANEKCELCNKVFQKWKFTTCDDDCEMKQCKSCVANLYRKEKGKECLSCFEEINQKEIEQLINSN